MHNSIYIFVVASFAYIAEEVQAQGVNLGSLHWCDTLCLCHDDTHEKLHCFDDLEIYSLLDVDVRKVQRLSRAGFKLKDKLMWCSETCLCHKAGKKEFKCTDRVKLGVFIEERAPFLSHYLEPEVEVFDVRDIVEKEDELIPSPPPPGEEDIEEKKDRHDRRKNKKHRKNRRKGHQDKKEAEHEDPPSTTMMPLEVKYVTPPEDRVVHSANILPQASTGRGGVPSSAPEPEAESPVLEVPRERKTLAGEVSNDLEELQDTIHQIKGDVALNQQILLVTVAVAAIAMIGVMLLAIYSCCVRRPSHFKGKGTKNGSSLRQDENSVKKVNLDEAW